MLRSDATGSVDVVIASAAKQSRGTPGGLRSPGSPRRFAPRDDVILGGSRVNPIVVVLNGPNLNLLGKREPEIYGRETLADVEADCSRVGKELGLAVEFHQSNREYEIIDWFHRPRERPAGLAINQAGFTLT